MKLSAPLLISALTAPLFTTAAPQGKPNILILLADDLGYADLGVQGCKDIPTPNIDSIASNGVRFTEAYVPGPQCVPSRMALMTGRYPQRGNSLAAGGMGAGTENGLALTETTLADRLHSAGYTSIALGKWHLGEQEKFQPQSRGFDEFYGFLAGMHSYVKADDKQWGPIMDGRTPGKLDGYLTDVLADRAVEFITRQQKTGNPWFTYLAFNAVHTPMNTRENKLQQFAGISDPQRRNYAAMVSSLDDGVGRVLAALREAGAEENTLIFFLSDNGGPLPGHAGYNGSQNAPLRGSKLEVWEGGVRVPFFIQWKGRVAAGRVIDGMVSSMDIAATAVRVAGADPKTGTPLDGLDLMPLLDGRPEAQRHNALFFEFLGQRAVRMGNLKWVSIPERKQPKGAKDKPDSMQLQSGEGLFDLQKDLGETRDLSNEQPERLKTLQDAYTRWSASVGQESVKQTQ
jgi:arylsulfatase A-like enzyme